MLSRWGWPNALDFSLDLELNIPWMYYLMNNSFTECFVHYLMNSNCTCVRSTTLDNFAPGQTSLDKKQSSRLHSTRWPNALDISLNMHVERCIVHKWSWGTSKVPCRSTLYTIIALRNDKFFNSPLIPSSSFVHDSYYVLTPSFCIDKRLTGQQPLKVSLLRLCDVRQKGVWLLQAFLVKIGTNSLVSIQNRHKFFGQ